MSGYGIVVDTSVGRGCGSALTDNLVSVKCRDVLMAIESYHHKVVICDALRREWRTHASAWAWHWLTNMISRNNHIAVDPNHCIELRKAMNRLPGNDREAVRKDLHLIESALDSDGRVISRDKSMRQILHGMILEVPEMESVKWVNPEDGKCLAWVMMGAPDDPDLQLSKDL